MHMATTSSKGHTGLDDCQHARHSLRDNASEGQAYMAAVLYHSRSLCCFSPAYDLGPQLWRHNIVDSEVPFSLGGCCRRSAAPCVGQRAVAGPDLHCVLPATLSALSVCKASALTAPRDRRTCTWPPAPAHGLRTLQLPAQRSRIQRIYPNPPDVSNAPKNKRNRIGAPYSTSTDRCNLQAASNVHDPACAVTLLSVNASGSQNNP